MLNGGLWIEFRQVYTVGQVRPGSRFALGKILGARWRVLAAHSRVTFHGFQAHGCQAAIGSSPRKPPPDPFNHRVCSGPGLPLGGTFAGIRARAIVTTTGPLFHHSLVSRVSAVPIAISCEMLAPRIELEISRDISEVGLGARLLREAASANQLHGIRECTYFQNIGLE